MGTWYPSGGGGGGGSAAVVESYDAEVATEAALQTAVTAGGRILVTADIALTDYIDLPNAATPVQLYLADDVVVTAYGGGGGDPAVFNPAAGSYDLRCEFGRDASFRAADASAYLVQGAISSASQLKGRVCLTVSGSGTWADIVEDGTPLSIRLEMLDWSLGDALSQLTLRDEACRVDEVILRGGGSNAIFRVDSGEGYLVRIGKVDVRATLKNVPAPTSVSYSLRLEGHIGALILDDSSPGIYLRTESSIGDIAGGTPYIYMGSATKIIGGGSHSKLYIISGGSTTNAPPCVIGARVLSYSAPSGTAQGVQFIGATLDSATINLANTVDTVFESCGLRSCTTTLTAGSDARMNGCRFRSGSLTINDGANAVIRSPSFEGVTITNNDPGTIITGSTDVSDDTDPTTRRFGNATLDALRPHIIAFWPGDELPEPSKAPVYGRSAGGSMQPRSAGSTLTEHGLNVAAVADGFSATCPNHVFSNYAQWTVSLIMRPVDATPAGEYNVLSWLSQRNTLGLQINIQSTGGIRIYYGPTGTASSGGSVSTGLFTDDTDSRITVTVRDNAGTQTMYVYVDGIEVLTWTGFAGALEQEYLVLGYRGAGSGMPAAYRDVYVMAIGISEATENLFDANSLKGAGIA